MQNLFLFSSKVYPITSDGQKRILFNGVPDWVYEGREKEREKEVA